MAVDLTWPDGLRGPLINSFNREEVVGFVESNVAAGPSFVTPISDDNPAFHNITYQFKEGDARRFQQFLRVNKVKQLSPWFNGPLITEDRSVEYQECRYTADGYPQLTGKTIGGIYTYSARVLTRDIVTNDELYPDELDALWGVNCGDIDYGANQLDIALNDW